MRISLTENTKVSISMGLLVIVLIFLITITITATSWKSDIEGRVNKVEGHVDRAREERVYDQKEMAILRDHQYAHDAILAEINAKLEYIIDNMRRNEG